MRNLARRAVSRLKRAIRGPTDFESLLDVAWYVKQNPDVSAEEDPLLHFVTYGASEGRDPNPLFDTDWYKASYPDAAHSGLSPLGHFTTIGVHKGYDPHPLFRTQWYLANNPGLRSTRLNPLADFLLNGLKRVLKPHPLFDTAWYLQRYPEVAERKVNPLVHYLIEGAGRGYDPNPWFDSRWYLARYPDVASDGKNPLRHYIEVGAGEGRDPSLRFETEWYRRQNKLARENPLEHFLTIGLKSGHEPLSRMGLRRNTAIEAARGGFAGLAACDPELTSQVDESTIAALPVRANVAVGPAFSAWKALLASFQTLYDRIIVVGSPADLASDSLAANALRLAHEAEGIDSVLLIITDDDVPADRGMIPDGTHVRRLGDIDPDLSDDHRAEIIQKLIYHLQPQLVLNDNSLALWRATAAFGGPLSSRSRLFAFLHYPVKDDRQRECVRYLRPGFPHLEQLIFKSPDNRDAAADDFELLASNRDSLAVSCPPATSVTDAVNAKETCTFLRCWLQTTPAS